MGNRDRRTGHCKPGSPAPTRRHPHVGPSKPPHVCVSREIGTHERRVPDRRSLGTPSPKDPSPDTVPTRHPYSRTYPQRHPPTRVDRGLREEGRRLSQTRLEGPPSPVRTTRKEQGAYSTRRSTPGSDGTEREGRSETGSYCPRVHSHHPAGPRHAHGPYRPGTGTRDHRGDLPFRVALFELERRRKRKKPLQYRYRSHVDRPRFALRDEDSKFLRFHSPSEPPHPDRFRTLTHGPGPMSATNGPRCDSPGRQPSVPTRETGVDRHHLMLGPWVLDFWDSDVMKLLGLEAHPGARAGAGPGRVGGREGDVDPRHRGSQREPQRIRPGPTTGETGVLPKHVLHVCGAHAHLGLPATRRYEQMPCADHQDGKASLSDRLLVLPEHPLPTHGRLRPTPRPHPPRSRARGEGRRGGEDDFGDRGVRLQVEGRVDVVAARPGSALRRVVVAGRQGRTDDARMGGVGQTRVGLDRTHSGDSSGET